MYEMPSCFFCGHRLDSGADDLCRTCDSKVQYGGSNHGASMPFTKGMHEDGGSYRKRSIPRPSDTSLQD